MSLVLLTNATQYAGPGALQAMLAAGRQVLCTDPSFAQPEARRAFEAAHPGSRCLAAHASAPVCEELLASWGLPDAVVSNDVHPITPCAIEDIPLQELQATYEDVLVAPVRLAQGLLPSMKTRGRGAFVFVTSAREQRPEPGFAVPTMLRAAATAFAKALAVEAARHGIQVNVVAPNYLYSEMYYPAQRFIHDPEGRARIASLVPFGRLGTQDEVGALIDFLASGRSPFTTGQVIRFTGGWSL